MTDSGVTKEQLKTENDDLHNQLRELNAEMERMLKRRNQKKDKKKTKEKEGHSQDYRQALARNEALRKERIRLSAEIMHSDTARRIAEVGNAIGAVDVEIEQLLGDIKSLENVKRQQEDVVDLAKHADEEMRFLQEEHRKELNVFRERWRQLQESVKEDEKKLFHLQVRYHAAAEKVKLGVTREQYDELKGNVDAQDARLEELRSQIDELAEKAEGGRKKVDQKVVKNAQEKQRLNMRIDQLRDVLRERERELKLSYAVHKTDKGKPTSS